MTKHRFEPNNLCIQKKYKKDSLAVKSVGVHICFGNSLP